VGKEVPKMRKAILRFAARRLRGAALTARRAADADSVVIYHFNGPPMVAWRACCTAPNVDETRQFTGMEPRSAPVEVMP